MIQKIFNWLKWIIAIVAGLFIYQKTKQKESAVFNKERYEENRDKAREEIDKKTDDENKNWMQKTFGVILVFFILTACTRQIVILQPVPLPPKLKTQILKEGLLIENESVKDFRKWYEADVPEWEKETNITLKQLK